MKRLAAPFLLSLIILLFSNGINAQNPPEVTWDGFFPGPGDYEIGNYTANDVKQSPNEGFVMTGSRSMNWKGYGYKEVMLMRVNVLGKSIQMNEIFTGFKIDSTYVEDEWVKDTIPWDQVANDLTFSYAEDLRYLVTGYRDTTLLDAETPPGLFLMEIGGMGQLYFDSLYYNNNLHHIEGQCITPAIGGGYIIASSFREDGAGGEQTMVTKLVKDKDGNYVHQDMPFYRIIPAGENGYARWISPCAEGYLMGGTAFTGQENKFDIFIQKLDVDRTLQWTEYYGWADSDEFAGALLYGDTIFVVGTGKVPVPETDYFKEQIYVAKLDMAGGVIWENTFGGSSRHFANEIMMTGEGDLLVAGFYYDASMHSQPVLMKIDAETGDSLWTQDYGNFYSSGIRDAIRTDDFGYLTVGRASYSGTQDKRVYVMKLDPGNEKEHLEIPRVDLGLPIIQGASVTDAIQFTTDIDSIAGLTVEIDTLKHPSVGDLEVSLSHDGTIVRLADRPQNSGKNFEHTKFNDSYYTLLDWTTAPYTGQFRPEDELEVFKSHKPAGEWTLSITDFGSGGTKATDRELVGWSLNILVEATGSGLGISPEEGLTNFGLEQVRPNPLGLEAIISFRIPAPGPVRLLVYNQLGQLVATLADEELPEGVHEQMWYAGSLAPGIYFIQLEAGNKRSIRKAMIAR